jgi:hypothetical protein
MNETQVGVLRLLADGKSAYTYCKNMAEHGARTGTVMALRRRGYVRGFDITDEGRLALAAEVARAAQRAGEPERGR